MSTDFQWPFTRIIDSRAYMNLILFTDSRITTLMKNFSILYIEFFSSFIENSNVLEKNQFFCGYSLRSLVCAWLKGPFIKVVMWFLTIKKNSRLLFSRSPEIIVYQHFRIEMPLPLIVWAWNTKCLHIFWKKWLIPWPKSYDAFVA